VGEEIPIEFCRGKRERSPAFIFSSPACSDLVSLIFYVQLSVVMLEKEEEKVKLKKKKKKK
jgi:hypothetical protein